MIAHEHVQSVPLVLIVVACAHCDALLSHVVVPLSAVFVLVVGILDEIFYVVDMVLFENLVTFSEDGIAHTAFLRPEKGICLRSVARTHVVVVVDGVGLVFLRLDQQLVKATEFESLVEDRVALNVVHLVANQTGRTGDNSVGLMEYTVHSLVVGADDARGVHERVAVNHLC